MILPKSIFRSYDIRGVYPTDLNEEYAEHIGKAFGTMLIQKKQKNVVVGQDDRESSPAISDHFIQGLLSTGCNVTNVGIALTPVIHFLTYSKKYDAGVMVTASHNPKAFNGFRIDYSDAVPFYGEDIAELHKIITTEQYATGKGVLNTREAFDDYLKFIKDLFPLKKSLKVIIDCGSGATSLIAPKLFKDIGQEVIPVYCNYDSNFTHGIPDPEDKVFMKDLSQKVKEHNADIGFAFDTDGDRFGVVDEKGNMYENDKLLLLFSENVLKHQNGTVICDVKCSSVLMDLIKSWGGFPKMMRTGHPFFVAEMKKGAILGAEYSGHTYFADKYFGFDDGIYAACRTLEILTASSQPMSELMNKYPKRYHTTEVKIDCHDAQKFSIIEKIKGLVSGVSEFEEVIDIDGVRVQVTKTGWFLIRASNTSPYLSIRVEGETQKEIDFLIKQVAGLLSSFKLNSAAINETEIYFS